MVDYIPMLCALGNQAGIVAINHRYHLCDGSAIGRFWTLALLYCMCPALVSPQLVEVNADLILRFIVNTQIFAFAKLCVMALSLGQKFLHAHHDGSKIVLVRSLYD